MKRFECAGAAILAAAVLCGGGQAFAQEASAPFSKADQDKSPQKSPGRANPDEIMEKFLAMGPAPDAEAVKRGKALFVPNCGFCHGSEARGGNSGPNLLRSGVVLKDNGTGKEIGPVIVNGRIDKGMPSFAFESAQIQDVAAFLLARKRDAVKVPDAAEANIVTGEPEAGRAYFTEQCASCHSVAGDLAHIATKYQALELQTKILYPTASVNRMARSATVDPHAATTVKVKLRSGEVVSGMLVRMDDFSAVIVDQSGTKRELSLENGDTTIVELRDPLQTHADMLPKYSDAAIHNLVAYLETLR
jgi:mono/diheme cytochrome c family protein/small nuclear ribonucleoprotein (snRNP)-like protein